MSALGDWKHRVESHHAQSIGVQDRESQSGDFWRPFASAFRDDPRRTDDPNVNRLLQEVNPDTDVLDVGGGAGRLALPFALHCRQVTVVEPSEAMLEQLREGARECGITNVSVLKGDWQEIQADHADIVLCAHVLYGVAGIEPFVQKLVSHSRERVLLLMYMESPQSHLSPFWRSVHGEDRIDLPAMPELTRALWEMDLYPDLELLETGDTHRFESREQAIEMLRRRLYVAPESEQDRRLYTAADELLTDTPEGLIVRGSQPRRLALATLHAIK